MLTLYPAFVNDVGRLCHVKETKKSFVVALIQTEDTFIHLYPPGSIPDRQKSLAIISDKTKIKTQVSSGPPNGDNDSASCRGKTPKKSAPSGRYQ